VVVVVRYLRSVWAVILRPVSLTSSLIRSSRPSTGLCSMLSRSFLHTSPTWPQSTTFNTSTHSLPASLFNSPQTICEYCQTVRYSFLCATAVPAGTADRILAMAILSVCPSRPGTESSPGEIETPGYHHMIA